MHFELKITQYMPSLNQSDWPNQWSDLKLYETKY